MLNKLIAGGLLTAVTALPLVAHAGWDDDLNQRKSSLEQKGTDLQQKGDDLENRGKALKAEGQSDEVKANRDIDEGKTVEKKSVTRYHDGQKKLKTTTEKVKPSDE